jgi:hypothetical protein
MNYALIAILLHSIVYLPFYLAMYLVAGAGVGILTGVVVTVANALLVGRLKPGHRFGLALRAAVAFVFFVGGWLLLATSFSPDLRIPTSVVGVLAGASVAAVISRNSVPASSASHDWLRVTIWPRPCFGGRHELEFRAERANMYDDERAGSDRQLAGRYSFCEARTAWTSAYFYGIKPYFAN